MVRYDFIRRKKEEYREIKPYYTSRFMGNGLLLMDKTPNAWGGKIIFRNGYSRKSPSFIATVTLDIGKGKPEWGAKKGEHYYILKIHSIDEMPWWIGKNCKDCGNEKCKKLGTLLKGYDCALWQAESEEV